MVLQAIYGIIQGVKNNKSGQSRKMKTVAFVCSSISSFKFLLLSGVTRYAQERRGTAVYPVDPPFLARALLALDGNLDKPISSSKLAADVGVSLSTLSTAFRKTFGTSVGKYALSVKMREAKRLAATGRFSVKEIAAMTGFSSQAHFCKTYRAFYGRTPSSDRHP